jgi:excinuclease ABC subunit A
MEPSYQGTFTGARRYILHTFTHSQSALMKKRVSQFMRGSPCPLCEGKRLKREALSVTFAGYDIGELSQMPLLQVAEVLRPVAAANYLEQAEESGDTLSHAQTREARPWRQRSRQCAGRAPHAEPVAGKTLGGATHC